MAKKKMELTEALMNVKGDVEINRLTKVIKVRKGGLLGLKSCSAVDCLKNYYGYTLL